MSAPEASIRSVSRRLREQQHPRARPRIPDGTLHDAGRRGRQNYQVRAAPFGQRCRSPPECRSLRGFHAYRAPQRRASSSRSGIVSVAATTCSRARHQHGEHQADGPLAQHQHHVPGRRARTAPPPSGRCSRAPRNWRVRRRPRPGSSPRRAPQSSPSPARTARIRRRPARIRP